jgi:hypothetical protein
MRMISLGAGSNGIGGGYCNFNQSATGTARSMLHPLDDDIVPLHGLQP